MNYHPHIHYLIPEGAISTDGRKWISAKNAFLMNYKPLAIIFRAKLKDALKKAELLGQIPSQVWLQEWVIDLKPIGDGNAALKYLVPYIFRIAISNRNILCCKKGKVTFKYKDSKTEHFKVMTLPAMEFMRRYLQHVLPRGFQKVRYYGFLTSKKRKQLDKIKRLLRIKIVKIEKSEKKEFVFNCPKCGRQMILIEKSHRLRAPPMEDIVFHQ